jgi:hypothetical protein
MDRKIFGRVAIALGLGAVFFAEVREVQAQEPAPVVTGGQTRQGFALGAGIATAPFAIGDEFLNLTTFSGAINLGYKIDRVVIGATFDFTRFGASSETDDGMGNTISVDQASYSFLVGPDLQVAILRSPDQRAELIGGAALMLGTVDSVTTTSIDPNPPPSSPNDPTNILLRWRVAPGVRYWMHPHIAFNGLVGFSGFHQIRDANGTASDRSASVTSLYTHFGLLGVF